VNNFDWIGKWAEYTPDKTALVSADTGKSYNFQELRQNSLKLEAWLKTHYKIAPGDRIAVLSRHSPEYVMLFFAAQALGAILVPLNYRASLEELNYFIKDAAPKLVLSEKKFNNKAQYLAKLHHLPTKDIREELSITTTPKMKTCQRKISPDDTVFIFYTSGTTGKPKGVLYTNKMLFWNSLNTSVELEITSSDITLNALPPYHTSGWNVLLLPMLHRGARVDFIKAFKPKKVLNYLQQKPISLFMAVPTMLRIMEKHPSFANFKSNCLKHIIVGGESLSSQLIDSYAQKGILLRQGYGLTEAGPCITSLHHHDALWKKGSIGKPNFYVEYKVVNENGTEVNINEAGELCLKGNVVTPGYWNNSVYTHQKIKDNWFYTGDILTVDEEGFMYLVGRQDYLFISGGENIFPSEIEEILIDRQWVKEAVVIGMAHEKWGQAGVAFVVSKNFKFGEKDLKEKLGKILSSYKIPQEFIFLDQLPKSGIGKVDRNKLKKRYKQNHYEEKTGI